jgi:hypothetical protein
MSKRSYFEEIWVKNEESPEMAKFNDALRVVMQVSKGDLKELLAKEKAANADKPKRGPKPVGQDC